MSSGGTEIRGTTGGEQVIGCHVYMYMSLLLHDNCDRQQSREQVNCCGLLSLTVDNESVALLSLSSNSGLGHTAVHPCILLPGWADGEVAHGVEEVRPLL